MKHAVSWRYVVGVTEFLNIVHEHIQGPKLPAINVQAIQLYFALFTHLYRTIDKTMHKSQKIFSLVDDSTFFILISHFSYISNYSYR